MVAKKIWFTRSQGIAVKAILEARAASVKQAHGKALELLLEVLKEHGVTEVPAGAEVDLESDQRWALCIAWEEKEKECQQRAPAASQEST